MAMSFQDQQGALDAGLQSSNHFDFEDVNTSVQFQGEVIAAGSKADELLRASIPGFHANQSEFIHVALRNTLSGQTAEISGRLEALPTGDLLFIEQDHFSGATLPLSENHIEIDRIKVMDDVNLVERSGRRGERVLEGTRRMHVSCYERPLAIQDPYQLPESLLGKPVQLTFIHDGDSDHPGNYLNVSGVLESINEQEGSIRLRTVHGREKYHGEITLSREHHHIVGVDYATLGVRYEEGSVLTVNKVSADRDAATDVAQWLTQHYGAGSFLSLETSEGTVTGRLQEFSYGHDNFPTIVIKSESGLHSFYMDEIKSVTPGKLDEIKEDRYHGASSGADSLYKTR